MVGETAEPADVASRVNEQEGTHMSAWDRPGTNRGASVKPYSSIQLLFLLRLVRILRVKQKYDSLPGTDAWISTLINRSIYSTFCDCIEQGVGDEARSLIAKGSGQNSG